jgi:hypothetical protein
MAHVKKGILTRAQEWWTHLRPFGRRAFWKAERRAQKKDTAERLKERQ